MNTSEKSTNRLWSFDGLRFLVVVFLIMHHFDMFNDLNLAGWDSMMKIFSEGSLSVNFFFVLSGFVIQYSYSDKLKKGIVSSKNFLLYRVFHLWPLYLLCMFIALFLYNGSYAVNNFAYPQFWVHFGMLQSFVVDNNFPYFYNGLAWAISTEMFFYIAFIVLVNLTPKKRYILTAGLWFIIILNISIIGINSPVAGWLYYINPLFRLADFMTGMLLCDIYRNKIFAPETTKSATIMEIVGVLTVVCFVVIAVNSNIGWEWRWQVYYTIPVCVLIYTFSFNKGILSKVLGSKPFRILGELAFPVYLNHQICLFIVKKYGASYITSANMALAAGGIAILLSIIVAVPMWYCFAKPINEKLRALVNKAKSAENR